MTDERDPRYCFMHQRIEQESYMSDPYGEIGTGVCEGCGQPVDTLNGRYACHTCGRNG